jgi:hypothetical protein
MARCPAHEDHDPSLSLRPIEGQVLIYCHAGCDTRDVLAALGMGWADLYDNPRGAEYRYDDGRVVHRTPAKAFRQSGNTTGTAQLYRLTKVKAAIAANEIVYVVEGEKDVHALESLGAVATTNPMGAANWAKVDPSPLHGGKVIVVPDVDQAGRRWFATCWPRSPGCVSRSTSALRGSASIPPTMWPPTKASTTSSLSRSCPTNPAATWPTRTP